MIHGLSDILIVTEALPIVLGPVCSMTQSQ